MVVSAMGAVYRAQRNAVPMCVCVWVKQFFLEARESTRPLSPNFAHFAVDDGNRLEIGITKNNMKLGTKHMM